MPDTTIRDLSAGAAVQDGDLFISRQGTDTSDVSVTGLQIKTYVGATSWGDITGTLSDQTDLQNALDAKQATGNYITALSGDITASGPGSVAATLATVNSNVGSFTNASITVNAKGLITAASSGTAPITNHNSLSGLQGGTTSEYYHLTSAEYTGTGTGVFVRKDAAALTGNVTLAGTEVITSTATSAFSVGPNGGTNPALRINNSQASANTGWEITAGAATRTAITVISPNSNENGDIFAKGNAALRVGATGSGGTFNVRLGTTNYVTVTSSATSITPPITTGTWKASVIAGQYGGTGVANTGKTITIGGNFVTSGAFSTTLTVTANTNVTLPTTGTLATLAGSEALTNKSVNGVTLTTAGSATDFLNAQGNYVAAGGGSSAFASLTSGTNTTAAMVVGTGASLSAGGSGTIAATSVTNATLTTALTVNTGSVTLAGNVANTSVLTIGAGAVSVSGTNTGDQTTITGNAGTATALQTARTIGGVSFDGTANIVPQTIQIVDAAADTTTFPMLATSATGSLQPATDPGLSYNASTNALTTTTFIGALTGNASTASAVPVGGISGLGTGVATFLATPSSANLAAAVTGETGSGALVFATSPTLVTPALGTPASGVLTNCTGTAAGLTAGTVTTNANLTGDVTSVGNATSIAAGVIVNADVNASAAIALSKLAATTASRALVSDASGFITAATTTATEIGYVNGVTSAIQTQINGKQASDATLTALAAYNTNGILTQTSADTFTGRTITGTSNRISVTNGDGISGNPTLDIGSDVVTLTGSQALTNKSVNGVTLVNAGTPTLYLSQDGTYTTPPSSSPFSASYTSAEQTITVGSVVTASHGLGATPSLFKTILRCKTAEANYAVGDEVEAGDADATPGSASARSMTSYVNSTTIGATVGASGLWVYNRTTGAPVSITTGNWRIVMRAWL